MPQFRSREIAVCVDMAGCPNRCRHCWLGNPANGHLSEEQFRWVARQFREWQYPGEDRPFIERLSVYSWYREPDYAANYRELWELEKALSDPGAAMRFELLSIWRLAREREYARWARDIGTEVCQISFFGLEETTDYFVRRRGAFRDSLLATERLLEAGIRPRWQLFLTERMLPELDGLLALVEELRLEERVRALGAEFAIFMHIAGPSGAGFHIEHLRPTVDTLERIPAYLVEKTLKHFNATSLPAVFGCAEGELVKQLVDEQAPHASYPNELAFFVTPELDVYANIEELMPWWKLGNLEADGLDVIMRRFVYDEVPGLQLNYHVPVGELAQHYGRPESRRLYGRSELIERWLRMWGEEQYGHLARA